MIPFVAQFRPRTPPPGAGRRGSCTSRSATISCCSPAARGVRRYSRFPGGARRSVDRRMRRALPDRDFRDVARSIVQRFRGACRRSAWLRPPVARFMGALPKQVRCCGAIAGAASSFVDAARRDPIRRIKRPESTARRPSHPSCSGSSGMHACSLAARRRPATASSEANAPMYQA